MAYLYILQSKKNGKFYIGSTAGNLQERVKKHQIGGVSFTSRNLPIVLVFFQKCRDIREAHMLETKLKKLKRKDYVEKIIRDGKLKLADIRD